MNLFRLSCLALISATLACISLPAAAQSTSFPTRSVRLVVGFPPGAGNDLIARAVANRLAEIWKQPVVVENRPGASGSIGADTVARAAPDGYTLLLVGSSHLIHAAMSQKLPYRAVEDYTPVSVVGTGQLVLEINKELPVNSVQELIALAKTRRLAYGSAGSGTSVHIIGEMFSRAAGVQMTHVPYKGSAPAQTDLIGGQVQLIFQVTQVALPSIRNNQVRALAVTGKSRLPDLPNLPTMMELGLPDATLEIWWGVMAPAGVPAATLRVLNEGVRQAVATPEAQRQLIAAGLQVRSSTSDEFQKTVRDDYNTFVKLVREANLKLAD